MALKKQGNYHTHLNFHALNKFIVKDKFPILVIDDLLDELHGAHLFSRLDPCFEYHKIWMNKVDFPKTAFHTHKQNNVFLVMHFGLCNAPSTF